MAWLLALLLGSLAVSAETGDAESDSPEAQAEALYRHRNLGKAFYENPATQYEAVGEWKKAVELAPDSIRDRVNYGMALLRAGQEKEGIVELEKVQEQDPGLPHTWFNLGVAYNRQSQYEKALEQFEGMVQRVPDEPITHYNLGVLYRLEDRLGDAIRHFERAAELDPNLAGPQFQLATAYRQAKRPDEARQARALFREIKTRNADAAVTEDLEWSWYAELYDPIDPADARPAGDPAPLAFERRTLLGSGAAVLVVVDIGGDRGPDLVVATGKELLLYEGASRETGRLELPGVDAIAAGDLDNDGLADLVLLAEGRPRIYRQSEGGFAAVDTELPAMGTYRGLVLVDYDHDYDLDLLLLGKESKLLRQQADGTWIDRSDAFPGVEGEAVAGEVLDVEADSQGADMAVVYTDRPGVIYRDRLAGRYEAVPLPALPAGARALAAHDVDHDGWTDL
ncbi:MAG: tetratricopeptide repeat protein, partial [Holophagales bacterium]|nr:tetratricopeptide repeat protein [Holophagales bacterium]